MSMRSLALVLSILLPLMAAARQADSTRTAALGEKLAEYYETLKHESLDVQKNECDFLIESTSDSLLRQFVALDIYGRCLLPYQRPAVEIRKCPGF